MPCPSATDPIDATHPEFPRDTRSRCVFDTWLHPSFVTCLRELSPRGPGTVRLTYLCRMAFIEQHGAGRIQTAAPIQTRTARLCQWAGWPVHGRKLARNGYGAHPHRASAVPYLDDPERDQLLVEPRRRRGYRIADVDLERDAAPFARGDARHGRL